MFNLPGNFRDNISLSNITISLSDYNTSGASVEWRFKSDGTGESYAGIGLVGTWNWCVPSFTTFADNYEVLSNYSSNPTPDPGQLWYSLDTDRSFGVSIGALSGSTSGNLTFFIRRIGSDLILTSATVTYNLDSGA